MNMEFNPSEARTARFQKRRDGILCTAAELMNEVGIGGMTFAEIADRVGMSAPSVTYYFKRKELLAKAVLDLAIDQLEAHVSIAAEQPSPEERVETFLRLELECWARARSGEAPRPAQFNELRALEEPMSSQLTRRYVETFRIVRGFFGPDDTPAAKAHNIARAHLLLDNIYAMPNWLRFYSDGDFPRVRARMMDIFQGGLIGAGRDWQAQPYDWNTTDSLPGNGHDAFLRAATRQINERGYRGASVDRIASDLQVTKGSFYHHNETKDQLVLRCFDRSYRRVTHIQRSVLGADWSNADRLLTAMRHLIEIQLVGDEPFLRTASLQFLPAEIKGGALERSARITRRFANLVIDGIIEGSMRPVDPLIAGQMLTVVINTARDLGHWSSPRFGLEAGALLEQSLGRGIFHS